MARRIVLATALALIASSLAFVPVTAARSPSIQVYRTAASFAAHARVAETFTFDGVPAYTAFGNPAVFDGVTIAHSNAATFKAFEGYDAPSLPNVLTPVAADGTITADGITTLTFDGRRTRSCGFFLIIGHGFNSEAFETTVVTVTNVKGESLDVTLTFQGQVGESQFVGFASRSPLASISFPFATMSDVMTVLAIDNLSIGR